LIYKTNAVDFTDCTALIYDEEGNELASVKILDYQANLNTIKVSENPALVAGNRCDVVILMSPIPYMFKGNIHAGGVYKRITLYKGEEKENRKNSRYKVSLLGLIDNLIYEGKKFRLHTAVKVKMVNLSRSGFRLNAHHNTLSKGDRFTLHVQTNENLKKMTAEVVNSSDSPFTNTEYGCRIITLPEEND
jgi:hypothetical protein